MVNRTPIFRSLLRLYSETIHNHERDQVDALVGLIDHVAHIPELLIELSNVIYHCGLSQSTNSAAKEVDDALELIKEKASENLSSDALLMIHSIMALRNYPTW